MKKYFALCLTTILLIFFSCEDKLDIIHEVNIHGIIIKVPDSYNIEVISSDSSEFIIKKSKENILYVNSSIGTGNFKNIFHTNENSLIAIVDSINRTFKYIYKKESNGKIDYTMIVGQKIEPFKFELTNDFDCNLIDTNDIAGKIEYEKCLSEKLLLESMEPVDQDVNIYLEISTNNNSLVMSNKKENMNTLVKYFDTIKLPKKFTAPSPHCP